MMDEITLVNLLNEICGQAGSLDWKLNCSYSDGSSTTIMHIDLYDPTDGNHHGDLSFKMETGIMMGGRYKGLVPFTQKCTIVDALLDILHYESTTKIPHLN